MNVLTGIHFLLTYRCTSECDHCFLYASPRSRGTFTLPQVRRVLEDVKTLGTITTIYFEGGEPFLYYPLLLESLRAAGEAGFRTGVVTNAYWAESEEDAELWLRPLRDLGVSDLSVSNDAFHHAMDGDDTPARRVIRAAETLGIPCGSISIPHPEQDEGVRFRGRAADKLTEGLPSLPCAEFEECPHEDLEDPGRVHVDAFGNVHLCQGLLIGNLLEIPLSELIEGWAPREHPICGPLLEGGPAALAAEYGVELEPGYASACHLCYRVRERLLGRFPRHLGPQQVYGVETLGPQVREQETLGPQVHGNEIVG